MTTARTGGHPRHGQWPWLARLVAGTALLLGCGTPSAPNIPDLTDGSLHVFGVLAADSTAHAVYVEQTDGLPLQDVSGVLSEVTSSGAVVPVATAAVLGQGVGFVLLFEARVLPGRQYRVTVTSPGRPTAMATTTVPADFAFERLEAAGSPPGSDGLDAAWTSSAGAFRYIVNVRAEPDCTSNPPLCESFGVPWAAVTAEPRIDTLVPVSAIPPDRTAAVEVAVYAVNRDLFEYFTTGVGGTFTVHPRQNVEGGYGVLGAWVRRQRTVQP